MLEKEKSGSLDVCFLHLFGFEMNCLKSVTNISTNTTLPCLTAGRSPEVAAFLTEFNVATPKKGYARWRGSTPTGAVVTSTRNTV